MVKLSKKACIKADYTLIYKIIYTNCKTKFLLIRLNISIMTIDQSDI